MTAKSPTTSACGLTGSAYYTASSATNHLFDGDRGGSRYYLVMSSPGAKPVMTSGPMLQPGFSDKGGCIPGRCLPESRWTRVLQLYEMQQPQPTEADTRTRSHIAADLLYCIGKEENLRRQCYNTVKADDASGEEVTINRYQLGGGWFLTDNVLSNSNMSISSIRTSPSSNFQDGEFKFS